MGKVTCLGECLNLLASPKISQNLDKVKKYLCVFTVRRPTLIFGLDPKPFYGTFNRKLDRGCPNGTNTPRGDNFSRYQKFHCDLDL